MSLPKLGGTEFAGVPLVLTAGVSYNDPDNVRFQESLRFVENANNKGVPVVVVNGSPEIVPEGRPDWQPTWVADAHRERGATVLRAVVPGIATQRQQGVAFAVTNGAEKIVGTESEKPEIPFAAGQLSRALEDADVLVVGRTQETEDTLPPVQQRTERLAGWILEQTHGLPRDALAGPRGFTVAGAEVLADYPATKPGMNNWLYMYTTPIEATRRGLRIGGVDTSFPYPNSMVAEETDNPAFDRKRLDQFQLQLDYLLRGDLAHSRCLPELDGERIYHIAGIVLGALHDWRNDTTNEDKLSGLTAIETQLIPFGYRPAERLQTA